MLVYTKEASGDSSLEQVRSYFESVWKMPECKTFGKSRFWKQNPSVKKAEGEIADAVKTLKEAYGDELGKIDYESITLPVNQIQLISNPTHILGERAGGILYHYGIDEAGEGGSGIPYSICHLRRLDAGKA